MNCLPAQAVKRLLKEAASTDKELKEFDGGYHEVRLCSAKMLLPTPQAVAAARATTDIAMPCLCCLVHQILFGPLKQDVIASLVTWVKSHTAGPGQGFA